VAGNSGGQGVGMREAGGREKPRARRRIEKNAMKSKKFCIYWIFNKLYLH
jgi:hypothetical protein